MANFLKILFGSCLGSLLALFVLFLIGSSIVAGIASSAEEKPTITANSVLHLDLSQVPELSGNVTPDSPFPDFRDLDSKILGLHDIVRVIETAAEDDDIKGLYLNYGNLSIPFTTMRTIRQAVERFRVTDKFTIAFAPNYSQSAYYLASACEEVYLGPLGIVDFRGLGAELFFVKNALDKAGIKMEVFYAGDYKSATELFRRTEASPENREQTKEFLTDLYGVMVNDIAASRGVAAADIRRAANNITGWRDTEAVAAGLVTDLVHRTEIDELLHDELGLDDDEAIQLVGLNRYFSARMDRLDGGGDTEVAVLIAEGSIIDGTGDPQTIGDRKYVNELEKLAEDDDVKAVVLRVNSGGGSASSSENIWYAVEHLKETGKPVVVSMGDYAASGGYYVAAGADRIFAEPTTITGSIGVFLTFPILKELMNDKIGVTFDTVNTADYATAFSPFRELSPGVSDLLNTRTEAIYETFVGRVAEGRNLSRERVLEIAGGRVYSGTRAAEIGLVDELAGLDGAIAYAAAQAGFDERDDYTIGHYPKTKPAFEQFLEEFVGSDDDGDNIVTEAVLRKQLGADAYEYFKFMRSVTQQQGAQARLPLKVTF